jgi:DNA invertase Pin-like site-specific DNA recombinase
MESQKVWQKVNDALRSGQGSVANKEKELVEQRQRDLREANKKKGIKHVPRYFKVLHKSG